MGLRMHRQVGAFRKVLSQQTIGVLIRAALPRALRVAEGGVQVPRSPFHRMSVGKDVVSVIRVFGTESGVI